MNSRKPYYHRHLPHYHPPDATLHVVFRLAGSLPEKIIAQMRAERIASEKHLAGMDVYNRRCEEWSLHQKAYFEKFDALLSRASVGPRWLSNPAIMNSVAEAIHHRDDKQYDLLSYCIMPNHVHIIYVGRNDISTYRVLQSLKRHTALKSNQILGLKGSFWQHESYDHAIRNGEELERTLWYVVWNPVIAGLVQSWEEYKETYVKPGLLQA